MEDINVRFKELRKACKKNQSNFGKVLGISASGITDIEAGRRRVTEKHLIMLSNWDEYNINIDWLQTGQGEMFLPTETDTLETLRKEYNLTEQQFNFVSNFLRMPESEKDMVFNFLSSIFNNNSIPNPSMEEIIHKNLNNYLQITESKKTEQ